MRGISITGFDLSSFRAAAALPETFTFSRSLLTDAPGVAVFGSVSASSSDGSGASIFVRSTASSRPDGSFATVFATASGQTVEGLFSITDWAL